MSDIKKYRNGNIDVTIDSEDGTKTRFTRDDVFRPEFSESIDVKITSECNGGCPYCYENCTMDGVHADLLDNWTKEVFIPSLHLYTEIAINGNDLSHPQLIFFLKRLKKQKVFANLTLNQQHFNSGCIEQIKEWFDNGLIHGLGISLTDSSNPSLYQNINRLERYHDRVVIHTIVGLVTQEDLRRLSNRSLNVLFLGYKLNGRGNSYFDRHAGTVIKNRDSLAESLPYWIDSKKFRVLSFDNLALNQLDVKSVLTENQWNEFYMGDDGDFTFYIDLVRHEFAQDSISKERFDIGQRNVDDMFHVIRNWKQIKEFLKH